MALVLRPAKKSVALPSRTDRLSVPIPKTVMSIVPKMYFLYHLLHAGNIYKAVQNFQKLAKM